jgi:hypothetical protein
MQKAFTLEDARKLAIVRAYALIIEKKASELVGSDADFAMVVSHIETLLAALGNVAEGLHATSASRDCYDGYDLCDDGICRVWCS